MRFELTDDQVSAMAAIDADPVRCADPAASSAMVREIDDARKAGRIPTDAPASSDAKTANANVVRSSPTSSTRGSDVCSAATIARSRSWPTSSPNAPPIIASNKLSVSSCLTSRPCPAPRATRTANSRRREMATSTSSTDRRRSSPTARTPTPSCSSASWMRATIRRTARADPTFEG